MSVDAVSLLRRVCVALGVQLCLAFPSSAWALDFPDVWHDPLDTRPDVRVLNAPVQPNGYSDRCVHAHVAGGTLALADAVHQSLCGNPQLQIAWSAIQTQAAAQGEARAAYWPTLNASVSRLENKTRFPDSTLNDTDRWGTTQHLNLTWRLLDFGARSAQLEVANQLLLAALASHDASVQRVLDQVIGAYFEAMTAQAIHQARREGVRVAQVVSEATLRRARRGLAAHSDVLQAATALAKAKLSHSRSQGELQKARSVLAYVMGTPGEATWQLPDDAGLSAPGLIQDLQQWLDDAQDRHPAIAAARAQLGAAQSRVKAVRAEGLPSLSFNESYYRNGYPNQGLSATNSKTTTIGLTLSIPLFEGFGHSYRVRGAQAQLTQSQAQLQDTVLQVSMAVVKAHADARAAHDNLHASQALLEAAQLALESAGKRYDRGAADVLELLSSQGALAEARQERVRSLAEWRAARLRLFTNSGALTLDMIDPPAMSR